MAMNLTNNGEAVLTEIGIKYLYPEVYNSGVGATEEVMRDALKRTTAMMNDACDTKVDLGTINGHFWVERDGNVIDPTLTTGGFARSQEQRNTMALDFAKTLNAKRGKMALALATKSEYIYVEAPPLTQNILVATIYAPYKKAFNGNLEFAMEAFEAYDYIPKYGCCNANALMEQRKNGGVIKFGSLGFKCLGVIDWVYGDEKYKTVKDYREYATTEAEERHKLEFLRGMAIACDADKRRLADFDRLMEMKMAELF